mmetsp:Transcript_22115/g.67936  ORF Transcript_22115/g.67936 Transcript_22115/m.67936 type:complete len:299 (+) Transcript_22115:791-1687(+)
MKLSLPVPADDFAVAAQGGLGGRAEARDALVEDAARKGVELEVQRVVRRQHVAHERRQRGVSRVAVVDRRRAHEVRAQLVAQELVGPRQVLEQPEPVHPHQPPLRELKALLRIAHLPGENVHVRVVHVAARPILLGQVYPVRQGARVALEHRVRRGRLRAAKVAAELAPHGGLERRGHALDGVPQHQRPREAARLLRVAPASAGDAVRPDLAAQAAGERRIGVVAPKEAHEGVVRRALGLTQRDVLLPAPHGVERRLHGPSPGFAHVQQDDAVLAMRGATQAVLPPAVKGFVRRFLRR